MFGHKQRAHLFYRQARLFWRDGQLTRRDRQLLDQLRSGLGLGLEEAAYLEERAVMATGGDERSPGPQGAGAHWV